MRLHPVILAFALMLPLAAGGSGGPLPGAACDASGNLVCIEAGTGGELFCSESPFDPSAIGCAGSWYAYSLRAHSPAGLPGNADGTLHVTETTCIGGACATSEGTFPLACAWEVLDEDGCRFMSTAHEPIGRGVVLQPAECVHITLHLELTTSARVPDALPLAEASAGGAQTLTTSHCRAV